MQPIEKFSAVKEPLEYQEELNHFLSGGTGVRIDRGNKFENQRLCNILSVNLRKRGFKCRSRADGDAMEILLREVADAINP